MPNIGASDPLKLAWPDYHYCFFLKNYTTKTGASNQSSLMCSDHHYQIICYKSWSKRWTKNCATRSSLSHYLSWQRCETNKGEGTNLDLCDQIITILSSAIPVLCDHINIIMICMTTVLHYKQLRWPTQVDVTRLSLLCYLSQQYLGQT